MADVLEHQRHVNSSGSGEPDKQASLVSVLQLRLAGGNGSSLQAAAGEDLYFVSSSAQKPNLKIS